MVNREKIKIEKVAFEGEKRGYCFKATYLEKPKGEALIEISKDGNIVQKFLFPAHKIYNIPAHANDIIDTLEQGNNSGISNNLSMREVLDIEHYLQYEVHSHWLVSWIGFEWGQELMSRYIARKVARKYKRYLYSL